jgi:acyl-CoA thioester hydrolase
MTRVFNWEFEVRSYELNSQRQVNHAVYHNYLEEAATRASADAGFGHEWYFRHGRAWVVREMTVRYLNPLQMGDRAQIRTWLSDFRRIYSHREYDMRRASDGAPVVRARAKWVYVNLETLRPERIPSEFESAFDPSGELEALPVALNGAVFYEGVPHFVSGRRVQSYEIDPTGHVNNSVYLNWFAQATSEMLEQAGWPDDRLQEYGLGLRQVARKIDYLRPAFSGNPIEVSSQLVGQDGQSVALQHDLVHAETGEAIASDYSVGMFYNRHTDQSLGVPAEVIESLVG